MDMWFGSTTLDKGANPKSPLSFPDQWHPCKVSQDICKKLFCVLSLRSTVHANQPMQGSLGCCRCIWTLFVWTVFAPASVDLSQLTYQWACTDHMGRRGQRVFQGSTNRVPKTFVCVCVCEHLQWKFLTNWPIFYLLRHWVTGCPGAKWKPHVQVCSLVFNSILFPTRTRIWYFCTDRLMITCQQGGWRLEIVAAVLLLGKLWGVVWYIFSGGAKNGKPRTIDKTVLFFFFLTSKRLQTRT